MRDGRALPSRGETIKHDGPVVPCKNGLHGSEQVVDALEYAPGSNVARVRLTGTLVPHDNDKWAASQRTMLTDYVDASQVLIEWARLCALRALRVHVATACRAVGMDEVAAKAESVNDAATLDEITAAARNAAMAAARNVGDAARNAAWNVGDAAMDARYAAMAAGNAAMDAGDAAWNVGDAAWNVGDAAWNVGDAARNARVAARNARVAAGDARAARAARDAGATGVAGAAMYAKEKAWQNGLLERMLRERLRANG